MEAALAIPSMRVNGLPFCEVPKDLFIPPNALEVLLDSFSGPLDLLLYLIRRENIDILDIPIAEVTRQYMQYIDLMSSQHMELAADYLVMAALLAEIKSRLLLPVICSEEEPESDPRQELVRKLLLYEQTKQAALCLDELPRAQRDFFPVVVRIERTSIPLAHPEVSLSLLTLAMQDLIKREGHLVHHQISREMLSVRERMGLILERLALAKSLCFTQLLNHAEGRMGLVVSFLAILELAKQSMVRINQAKPFCVITLQVASHGG
ncbi:MAG: segregation/condensation protein A [Tatlockia sp.]|jgi:segregation and condensation protein A